MRLAFLSSEYPPDTAVGGIGTYTLHLAAALVRAGHDVEVFCSSPYRDSPDETPYPGLRVHRIRSADAATHRQRLVPAVVARHAARPFDLVESPEFGAEGLLLRSALPRLPMAVRLHTPSYLAGGLNRHFRDRTLRRRLGRRLGFYRYRREDDLEYRMALAGDALSAPSTSLAAIATEDWGLPPGRVAYVPNVYAPSPELLSIPLDTQHRRVTYFGRLEVRKGMVALAEAIPRVLRRLPDVHFRFIGRTNRAPTGRGRMVDWLARRLAPHRDRIELIDRVPLDQIPRYLAETDVCAYPALWDNSPNTCLEAMSAGRGVVGSIRSGMRDMLEEARAGILIEPEDVEALSGAIVRLLEHPGERAAMGARARERIVRYYADEAVRLNQEFFARVAGKAWPA